MRKLLFIVPLIIFIIISITGIVIVNHVVNNHIKYQKDIAMLKSEKYTVSLQNYLNERYLLCKSQSIVQQTNRQMKGSINFINTLLTNTLISETDIKSVWYITSYIDGHLSDANQIVVQYKDKGNKIKSVDTQTNTNDFSKEIMSRYIVSNKAYISNPFYHNYPLSDIEKQLICRIGVPVLSKGVQIGMFGIDIDMRALNKITSLAVFNENGYSYILSDDATIVTHNEQTLVGSREIEIFSQYAEKYSIAKKMRGSIRFSFIISSDELSRIKQNVNFDAICSYIPVKFNGSEQTWYSVVVVPLNSSYQLIREFLWIPLLITFIGLIAIVLIINTAIKKAVKPLKIVSKATEQLSKGKLTEIDIANGEKIPELKSITHNLKLLVDTMNNIVAFSRNISKGNYENDFEMRDEDDSVGKALIELAESLKKVKEAEEERKREDEKRNWQTQGLAEFGELTRKYNNDLETLSIKLLSGIINYLNANQGGIFTVNNRDKENPKLELISSYAYDTQKYIHKDILFGEGIVGTCAIEKKTIYLKEIPDNYIEITSGLGGATPNVLLVVPMLHDNEVLGVIEIASFNEFNKYEIEFAEKIAETFSSTLANLKINEETNRLLDNSRLQAEEVRSSEEEMRQNLEELMATQEELQRKNDEYEEMQEELRSEQQLFDKLLRNIPALVYFKDIDGRYIKASESLADLLGVENIENVIGTTDEEYFTHNIAHKLYSDELEIMQTGEPKLNIEEELVTNSGETIYVRTSKLPLFDSNKHITGILGITQNITDMIEIKDKLENCNEKLKMYE